MERHPHLAIELHHEVSGAAFGKVLEGELDASFYYGDKSNPLVAALPLRTMAYRIAAPAGWKNRIAEADWQTIASEPWIMTPPISTHHALATAFFDAHGVAPAKFIEADNEGVITFLVGAGLGLALVREDVALPAAEAGEICLWRDIRLPTMLYFIYLRSREGDPEIDALLQVLRETWPDRPETGGG
jgi:DNA-binding transcriptional LysR family regulator